MPPLFYTCDHCLLCRSEGLQRVVELAPIPIATPNFKVPDNVGEIGAFDRSVPLDLMLCRECGQLQVGHVGNPELQYRNYVYTTSLSQGLREHFAKYADEVISAHAPTPGSLVAEIGSNDGTLLGFFKERGMRVLGVDPAEAIARRATESGIETLPAFFGEEIGARMRRNHGPAQVVIANNVFANLEDPTGVARGVRALLADDGVFIFETQYGASVIEGNLLDTVYHEHLSYFMVKPLADFFARLDMEVVDVEKIATKGGSIRVTVRHAAAARQAEPRVAEMIGEETRKGMFGPEYYQGFAARIADLRRDLAVLVDTARAKDKPVAGYGVSVGTTTLLSQLGLADKIDFLVDDDPNKDDVLTGPGYRIPVLPAEAIYERNPGAIIVFAWRYADSIIAKNRQYAEQGGKFVIPLPGITVR